MNPNGTIGPYRLLSALGKGGMGVVYLAEHQETKQRVALKTVRVPKASLLGSIRREIQALVRLRHPNIVRIFDEGIGCAPHWQHAGSLHQGLPWYTMELLEGQELRQWMSQPLERASGDSATILHTSPSVDTESSAPQNNTAQGSPWRRTLSIDEPLITEEVAPSPKVMPRPIEDILNVAHQLCAPLAFLHGEGLLHKDLKPENILVRPDGTVVLVDFGLATRSGGESSREILAIEVGITGTAYYMSPEQIEDEILDARTDLYSFGVILYELLTGQRPFTGENLHKIILAHLTETPRPPSELRRSIPSELDALVLRLLAKNRRDRPGYAQDIALALTRIIESSPSGPIPHSPHHAFSIPRPYLYRPSFSGRQEQLAKLRGYLGQVERGEGGLVLLGGESGVGKTRLVVELAREAAQRGKPVLSGDCHDTVSRSALSVFQRPLQKIGDYCRERGQEGTSRILGQRGKLLAAYEPSLLSLPGQDTLHEPAELPADAARLRIFTSLGETLSLFAKEATRSKGLLLVLDDLQWADELSLGFLQFFLRNAGLSSSMLIIGTYRSEEFSEGLQGLLQHANAKKLELGRLEERAVAEMVGEMLAMTPAPLIFSQFLSKSSEGNPFFVAEYLRTAVEEGLLRRDQEGRWQIGDTDDDAPEAQYEQLSLPRSLRALVERRLSGLSARAKSKAELASILGREFPLEFWERISPDALLLDELIKRQVLEEATPGVLRFVHDKLREGLVERIEGGQRPQLHRAVAQALEELGKWREHLAALGHHWEQAGETDKAGDYYLAGARKAAAAYSYEESERLYQAYLRLVTTPTETSITARNELGEKVFQPQGKMDKASEEHTRAVEEAAQLPRLAVHGLRLLGVVHWKTGRPDEARLFFERALRLSRELGARGEEGMCLRQLGILRYENGRPDEARPLYERALELQRQAGDRSQEGLCLNSLAVLYHDQGRLEEARVHHERALYLARIVGDHRFEGICLSNLSVLYGQQGRLAEALPLFEQAFQLARKVGDRRSEGVCLSQLAGLYHLQENIEEAQRLYEKVLVIHREVGNRRSEGICLSSLANIHRDQGRLNTSRQLYEQAINILQEVGNHRFKGVCLAGFAEQERWEKGDPQATEEHCNEAESTLRDVGDKAEIGKVLCTRGFLSLWRGQSAKPFIKQAQDLATASQEIDLRKSLDRLEQAQAAFDASRLDLLFRGELISNIPALMRRWLAESGQLPG